MNELIQQHDNHGFMRFSSINEALKFGEIIASSSICPKNFSGKPADVLVAVQMGLELGLKPMQSLQNIAVINGRPSIWGDAMLAICKAGTDFEYCNEIFDEKTQTAICHVKRKGEPEQTRTFSFEDAKRAGLLGKQGPWMQYPARMCQMRARGFALRDVFPHLLRGLVSTEEAKDTHISVVHTKRAIKTVVAQSENLVANENHLEAIETNAMNHDTWVELLTLIKEKSIDDDTIHKWLDKAMVPELTDLPESKAQSIIEYLKKK